MDIGFNSMDISYKDILISACTVVGAVSSALIIEREIGLANSLPLLATLGVTMVGISLLFRNPKSVKIGMNVPCLSGIKEV